MLRALIGAAGSAGARPEGGTPVAFVAVPLRNEVVAVDLTGARIVGRVRVPRGPAAVAWF